MRSELGSQWLCWVRELGVGAGESGSIAVPVLLGYSIDGRVGDVVVPCWTHLALAMYGWVGVQHPPPPVVVQHFGVGRWVPEEKMLPFFAVGSG